MESIQQQGQGMPMLQMIAASGRSVAYHPNFACITGSAIAALLLQQMIFWWDVKKRQKFYKFKIPAPKHKAYVDGDSWCEELALTRHEFDTALKRIGTKIDAQHTREAFYKFQMPRAEDFVGYEAGYAKALEEAIKHFVAYWTDSDRKTWYEVNGLLIERFMNQAMEPKAGIQLYLSKSRFRLYLVNRESGFTYTENTTEKNSIEEKTLRVSGQSPSHAVAGSGEPPRTPPDGEHVMGEHEMSGNVSEVPNGSTIAKIATDQDQTDQTDQTGNKVTPSKQSIEDPNPLIPGVPPSPVLRTLLDDAPAGLEWWFTGVDAGIAHLKEAGKTPLTRPLCKRKQWAMPNKCHRQIAYVPCAECVAKASKPKVEKPKHEAINQVLKDAVAVQLQGIDPALSGDTTWLIANKAAGIWKKKLGRALTGEDYEKIARSLDKTSEKGFPRWFYKQCKDCSLPSESPRKFESWYSKFVTALDKSNGSEVTTNVDGTEFTPEYVDWLRRQVEQRRGKQDHGSH